MYEYALHVPATWQLRLLSVRNFFSKIAEHRHQINHEHSVVLPSSLFTLVKSYDAIQTNSNFRSPAHNLLHGVTLLGIC